MSKCTLIIAMDRIKSATNESPIAVFHHSLKGYLDCVFFSTVATKRRMKTEIPIGIYSNNMDMDYVKKELSVICKKGNYL